MVSQVTFDSAPVDGTNLDHLTRAELIGRSHVVEAARFLRTSVPGFEHSYLLEVAPQIGIRETRRIVGRYVLAEAEVLGGASFPDAIGCCGWPVEKHVLGGVEWRLVGGRGYYQLPYRCLLPQGVDNLLVGGRCLSATQDAQASARVSGPCFVMGQAAGTAAVLSLRTGRPPADLDVCELQKSLRTQGVELGD